jgi:hypothetical protein
VGCWSMQRVAPWRGTTLVTTAHVSATCFGLISHVVEDGGVLWLRIVVCCGGCVYFYSGVCLCGSVCFDPLCTYAVF